MPATQRFFFDDGSARKQWQVTQRGRTQTVAYERIGGKLVDRKSKGQFQSSGRKLGGAHAVDCRALSVNRAHPKGDG